MKSSFLRTTCVLLALLTFSLSCEKLRRECDLCEYVDYYYYKEEPKQLGPMSNDYLLLGYDSILNNSEIYELVGSYSFIDKNYRSSIVQDNESKFKYTIVKLKRSYNCSRINCFQNELIQNRDVGYANYTSIVENCTDMHGWQTDSSCVASYGETFLVKVRDSVELNDLFNTIEETGTEILFQYDLRKNWFMVGVDKHSDGNALEMANFFVETGLFAAAAPGFVTFEVE